MFFKCEKILLTCLFAQFTMIIHTKKEFTCTVFDYTFLEEKKTQT